VAVACFFYGSLGSIVINYDSKIILQTVNKAYRYTGNEFYCCNCRRLYL